MAQKWLKKLTVEYPALAESAVRLNRRDNFLMPNDRKKVEQNENNDEDSSGSKKGKKRKKDKKKNEEGTKKLRM